MNIKSRDKNILTDKMDLNKGLLLKRWNTFYLFGIITVIYLIPTIRIFGNIPVRAELLLSSFYLLILLIIFKESISITRFGIFYVHLLLVNFIFQIFMVFIYTF
ncbi:hypothetical protein, partial [Bacillus sp. MM2020_4]|uniref:hypothetical protein n=1 Tax=Bacillus sp. MM2020_4 TaxID=2714039 RepID=UPI001A97EDFE